MRATRAGRLSAVGPGWTARDLDAVLEDNERREQLLQIIERVEEEPSLLGMSFHLMAVATLG